MPSAFQPRFGSVTVPSHRGTSPQIPTSTAPKPPAPARCSLSISTSHHQAASRTSSCPCNCPPHPRLPLECSTPRGKESKIRPRWPWQKPRCPQPASQAKSCPRTRHRCPRPRNSRSGTCTTKTCAINALLRLKVCASTASSQ